MAYNKDTGACKLEISMTFPDDAGEYTIFARNQIGESSASAFLLEEGWFKIDLYNTVAIHVLYMDRVNHMCFFLQRHMRPI